MYRTLFLSLLLTTLGSSREAAAPNKTSFDGSRLVDKPGHICKPDDHHDLYPMIGAYTALDSKGNQMHLTYASPGAAEYYRRNKNQFLECTVLVKDALGGAHG